MWAALRLAPVLLLLLSVVLGGAETESVSEVSVNAAAELKFLKALVLIQAKKLERLEEDLKNATGIDYFD